MSYAIGYVIYGVADTDELREQLNQLDKSEDDLEELGFQFAYYGRLMFGIPIDQIDETEDVDLTSMFEKFFATNVAIKYQEKLSHLPEEIRNILPPPKWMIVWGQS